MWLQRSGGPIECHWTSTWTISTKLSGIMAVSVSSCPELHWPSFSLRIHSPLGSQTKSLEAWQSAVWILGLGYRIQNNCLRDGAHVTIIGWFRDPSSPGPKERLDQVGDSCRLYCGDWQTLPHLLWVLTDVVQEMSVHRCLTAAWPPWLSQHALFPGSWFGRLHSSPFCEVMELLEVSNSCTKEHFELSKPCQGSESRATGIKKWAHAKIHKQTSTCSFHN